MVTAAMTEKAVCLSVSMVHRALYLRAQHQVACRRAASKHRCGIVCQSNKSLPSKCARMSAIRLAARFTTVALFVILKQYDDKQRTRFQCCTDIC